MDSRFKDVEVEISSFPSGSQSLETIMAGQLASSFRSFCCAYLHVRLGGRAVTAEDGHTEWIMSWMMRAPRLMAHVLRRAEDGRYPMHRGHIC
jgi:hypothetical protein